MADNKENQDARFSTAIGLGVWRDENGNPVREYDPWELEADRLLGEVGKLHTEEAIDAYFDFLQTRPDHLK